MSPLTAPSTIAALLVAGATVAAAPASAAQAIDERLPPVCFQDVARRERCVAQFRGQVVVLNLWATFCVPCVHELPWLDALHRRLRDRGVTVLAVAVDRRGAGAVHAMRERLQIGALDFYLDAQARSLAALGARGIPLTLLIDPSGVVRHRFTGAIGDREAELERLALSLAQPPSPTADTDTETHR